MIYKKTASLKNGFTLIEALAVIIILGIIMLIAVPSVSKYILNSDRSTYASDVSAYLETARAEYEMKEYGTFLKDDEVMIVPIRYIELEKGSKESPFGEFDLTKSYIVIAPYKNGYQYYANVVDSQGKGVVMKAQNELNKEAVEDDIENQIEPYEAYYNSAVSMVINKNTYQMCEIRDIETSERLEEDAIIVMCSTGEFNNPDEVEQVVNIKAENQSGKEIKTNTYTNSGLDFTFTKKENVSPDSKIYYCQDTTNTCIPDKEVEEGTKISDYNTLTNTYFIRYKIVGKENMGNDYSYKAIFDLEKPICAFKEAPVVYVNKGLYNLEMECNDSLSKLQGMTNTGVFSLSKYTIDEEIKDKFTFNTNNLEIEEIIKETSKNGLKYSVALKGLSHGDTVITLNADAVKDNAENGNESISTNVVVNGVFKVTLNNQSATSAGTTEIYELYSDGWYSDSNVTNKITSITKPIRTGYTFGGYYTSTNGGGTQIIDQNGNIVSGKTTQFNVDGTLYAKWTANQLIFDGKTITRNYGDATSNVTFTAATNGTGSYTYTEKSEKNSSGTNTSYISVNGTTITIQNTIPAGTYTYVVTAKDNNSQVTKDATFTIVVNKVAAVITCSNKTYNGANQVACSCSGGTIGGDYQATNYRATAYTASCSPDGNHTAPSNETWTMGRKALTITAKDQTVNYGTAITKTTAMVTASGLVSGDSLTGITLSQSTANYTTNGTITPSSATTSKGEGNYSITYNNGVLKVNKVAAVLTCSNKTYNGANQVACSCSGGTIGGEYQATNYRATEYSASCTPDGNHTAPSNKTWTMERKALTITAKDQTVNYGTAITKTTAMVTASGLVNGDSLTGITLSQSTTNYTTNGTITPSSAVTSKGAGNYSITYNNGVLKINKVAAVLTCNNKTYNGANQVACSCSGGTIGGDYQATNYRATAYTASCTPDGNHTAPSNKTWTMGRKALTITAKDQTVNYGTAITKTTAMVTTSGLVSGDSLTGITLAQSTTNYTTNGTITPSSATTSKGAGNYSITYNKGVLKVNKVAAAITCLSPAYTGNDLTIASCSGGSISGNVKRLVGSYTVTCTGDSNHTTSTKSCSITGCNRWELSNYTSNPTIGNHAWQYFDTNCKLVTSGWVYTSGEVTVNPDSAQTKFWYYIENSKMKTGWHQESSGCWYYLSEEDINNNGVLDGAMFANRTSVIGGSTYSFNSNGRCYSGSGCSSSCNY